MKIKSSDSFELIKDIQSPEFVRTLLKGEIISGFWIKTWFKHIHENQFNDFFKSRKDIGCYHCMSAAIDGRDVTGKYLQTKS